MTLDVPSEYEDVLRRAVASGAFANEEAALRHALRLLAEQQQDDAELMQLPERIDIEELASRQGAKPFRAIDPRPVNIWPVDESTDEFLVFLRESRQEEPRPGATQ